MYRKKARVFRKRARNTKVTFKAKCMASKPENGVPGALWREINPDCGNNVKCYIMGHEIYLLGGGGGEGPKR